MTKHIDSHISYLLHLNDCVIIPDFGGFVANYQSAKIDPVINLMHPPKKHIVFNKSLQNNDGLLVNELASFEGISFKNAQKEIQAYVNDLKDEILLHKKVVIEGVGTIIQSSDQTLLFVQDLTTNHLLSSYGMSTLQSPVIVRQGVQERIEAKIKHLDKEHLPSNKKALLKVAAILAPLVMISFIGITQQQELKTVVANLNPFAKTTTSLVNNTAAEASFDYVIHTASHQIESGVRLSFEEKLAAKKIVSDNTPTHFIIAGAFSAERNANKLVRKLKSWNFENARVIGKSKNGLYRVCYDGFVNSQEALNSLRQIKGPTLLLGSYQCKRYGLKNA